MSRLVSLVEDAERTGRVLAINSKCEAEMPYFLLTNQPNNIVNVPANQSVPMQIMGISGEGPASLAALGHEKTGVALISMQIQDGQNIQNLMNQPVHIDTIAGTGAQPYRFAEALYLDERRSLQVTFTDLSGGANAIRLATIGYRMLTQQIDTTLTRVRKRMAERQYLSVPYWYTFDTGFVNQLGVGGVINMTITIGQDHHFQWFKLSGAATGPYDLDIVNGQTGESLICAPGATHYQIGSDVVVGTANFPYVFHEPVLIEAGQQLVVQITNRHGAANDIYLTLGGRRLTLRMWR